MQKMRFGFVAGCFLVLSSSAAWGASAGGPGLKTFNDVCSLCHQTQGAGLAGQFPRLADRARDIAQTPDGRKYMISLVLYGMSCSITVDGTPIVGVMPGFATTYSNGALADVLNYAVRLGAGGGARGKVMSFTAAEVNAQRKDPPLSTADVHAMRQQLEASGALPK